MVAFFCGGRWPSSRLRLWQGLLGSSKDIGGSRMEAAQQTWSIPQDNTLLIVDDDRAFLARLARAMESRGFQVETAPSVEDGLISLRRRPPAFAVVDMRLDDGSGIDVIAALKD